MTSVAIDFLVNSRILLLPSQRNASIAPAQGPRSSRNCGVPGRRSPEPFVRRPSWIATRFPPRPVRQRNRATAHSRRSDCPDSLVAPAPGLPVLSSLQWLRRIQMTPAAIIDDTIALLGVGFTLPGKRICWRQVAGTHRRLAVTAWNIEYVVGLT